MSAPSQALRRTALFDEHTPLGAKMVPFAGFEMPVQYAGILKEHEAVRHRAGLFDLSHMGQFEIHGDVAEVARWFDGLTVNAVATMKPGQARYNLFCNEGGGALDDVIFYHLGDRWYLVVNASNAEKIWNHLLANPSDAATLANHHGKRALIAIQGPKSVEILAPLVEVDIAAMKYYSVVETHAAGMAAIVARTGYTGEDGFELFVDGFEAPALWRRVLAAGAAAGIAPAGLGARDVLRLEAGMPLYGHELEEDISPLAAGLNWAVKLTKPEFIGRAALAAQAAADDFDRIAGVIVESKAPARAGYPVFHNGRRVGEVRSGAPAPSVGNANIATVLVEKSATALDTSLEVEIRGTRHPARVVSTPFYKRSK